MARASSYLPKLVKTKIYKTGQTRGADDDVIYQNRVGRNSTVLIPYKDYEICKQAPSESGQYENGFIVLIKPEDYFSSLTHKGLILGKNLLVFYETREQWIKYPPLKNWKAAISRNFPLGGEYVARIPATTSEGQSKIVEGFCTSLMKGAGIRVYEYSTLQNNNDCKLQLEVLFWSCKDIEEFIKGTENPSAVRNYIIELKNEAMKKGLYDRTKLEQARIVDADGCTICPLCLQHISAIGFCRKIQQAEGRVVPDLTVTEVRLFHIRELRTGEFNHRPYNLGWGHHHCNVVVKDSGIDATLDWMRHVLIKNNIKTL